MFKDLFIFPISVLHPHGSFTEISQIYLFWLCLQNTRKHWLNESKNLLDVICILSRFINNLSHGIFQILFLLVRHVGRRATNNSKMKNLCHYLQWQPLLTFFICAFRTMLGKRKKSDEEQTSRQDRSEVKLAKSDKSASIHKEDLELSLPVEIFQK